VAHGRVEFLFLACEPDEDGKVIALLAAVREEISGVRRRMAVQASIRGPGWHLYEGRYAGKEVLLVQTGMGRRKAENATRCVLEGYPVTTLITFGFAGALCQELKVGDVVLCQALFCEADRAGAAACHSDQRLLPLAAGALKGGAIHVLQGSSVTVSQAAIDPERKQCLGVTFGAQAVDMESYWVARLAGARKTPFLAVHAISDTVAERLPPFDRFFGSDGEWLWPEAARHFAAHPGELLRLAWLFRNTRQAGRSLAGFLDAFIPELEDG
jgi:adenosylhomocysteine nucleosidase